MQVVPLISFTEPVMSRLFRPGGFRISSEALDARVSSLACYGAAVLLLLMVFRGVTKFATTPFEIFLGLLVGSTCASVFIVMGMVLPLTIGQGKR